MEGDEQTARAELRGLRVVTQINLGGSEPSAPTAEVFRPALFASIVLNLQHSKAHWAMPCSNLFRLRVLHGTFSLHTIVIAAYDCHCSVACSYWPKSAILASAADDAERCSQQ